MMCMKYQIKYYDNTFSLNSNINMYSDMYTRNNNKTYKMNKIILTIGVAATFIATPKKDGTRVDSVEKNKYLLSEALNNIQDMKEWMKNDVSNDNVITDLGEFYLEYLDQTEDILIEFSNTK